MEIYLCEADMNKYQNLVVTNEADWNVFMSFNGTTKLNNWVSPVLEILKDDEYNKNLPESDFPHLLCGVPVFSKKALKYLDPLIHEYGEILPLNFQGSDLFAFNVTNLVDGLNMSLSEYITFDDGRIMQIKKHSFIANNVNDIPIFKLIQYPISNVYVNVGFVDIVKKHKLIGFNFVIV
jgi:hypothetical protein